MIGFGLSEKPAREHAHSLDGHIANLTALLRTLDLQRVTLVCHDWGGPTGLGFALHNPIAHASAGADEHLGLAAATGRVPHSHFSVAHDARAIARALSARAAQCAGQARHLSVGGRSQAISGARAGGIRSRAARSGEPSADLDLAALDPAGRDVRAPSNASPGWNANLRACTLADVAGLGPRGRRIRPGDLRPTLSGSCCRMPRDRIW